jgi:hypothetical protein
LILGYFGSFSWPELPISAVMVLTQKRSDLSAAPIHYFHLANHKFSKAEVEKPYRKSLT